MYLNASEEFEVSLHYSKSYYRIYICLTVVSNVYNQSYEQHLGNGSIKSVRN